MAQMTGSPAGINMHWNSKAVGHLKEGDVGACILLLKKELAMVRSSFVQSDMQEGRDVMMQEDEPEELGESFKSVSIAPSQSGEPPVWEDCHQNPNNLFSFYPRAFVVEGKEGHSPFHPDARHVVVLLYNLALANHVEAAQNGWSKQSLDNAWSLYESALEVADASWEEPDYEELRCLLLAALNNMGFISSLRMDFWETRNCLDMMCQLVDLETHRQDGGSGANAMPEEDFELFFQSVFTFMDAGTEQSLCVAPAA